LGGETREKLQKKEHGVPDRLGFEKHEEELPTEGPRDEYSAPQKKETYGGAKEGEQNRSRIRCSLGRGKAR